MYTTTITVGINFDRVHFDSLFVYGTCMSATVRDIFQATMRVRHLRNNKMYYYLQSRYWGDDYDDKSLSLQFLNCKIDQCRNSLDEYVSLHSKFGIWKDETDWLRLNHLANLEEQARSCVRYTDVFNQYLKTCNYSSSSISSKK